MLYYLLNKQYSCYLIKLPPKSSNDNEIINQQSKERTAFNTHSFSGINFSAIAIFLKEQCNEERTWCPQSKADVSTCS